MWLSEKWAANILIYFAIIFMDPIVFIFIILVFHMEESILELYESRYHLGDEENAYKTIMGFTKGFNLFWKTDLKKWNSTVL